MYVEPRIAMIVRKGTLLVNPTNEELIKLHEQSKENLSDEYWRQ